MKYLILLFTLSLFVCTLSAQEDFSDKVKVGDQLMIAKPASLSYQSINVPRKNFIIKRGGIPNVSTLKNSIVTITKISGKDNPIITFKRSNGKKFFKAYRTLTAELNTAINIGEMEVYDH